MPPSILSVQNVTKQFGSLRAVDNVSLEIPQQRVSILIGPNGSGKTTLINLVSGLYTPDSGKVWFEGENVTGMPPYKLYARGLARTFQIPALFWKLTVLENLLIADKDNPGEKFSRSLFRGTWKANEIKATEKAAVILESVGLSKIWDRPTFLLSGGQLKLVEIGRALMSDSKLLLLDEPISGVNPTLAHEIFNRILKLRDELGLTFFIVEHRLDIAMKYVDEMFAMALGKVIANGSPQEVTNNRKVIDAYLGG
jgi:branched-chain amino acid transport system ATP-binding protein